jgi:hypothetical protein
MKKLLLVSMLLSVFLVGCKKEEKNYEEILKSSAEEYVEKYSSSVIGLVDVFTVSVADLKNANNNGGGDFDIAFFEGCTDDTQVSMSIDSETKEVVEYEYLIKCK